MKRNPPWTILVLLALILIVTASGPAEKSLGSVARIIYLHGALVWAAILAFGAAALLGGGGLVSRRDWLHRASRAAGRVALVFWIAYLPISMWAAQAAWGRVFLADPSFQKAFRVLAVTVIVQVIIWLRPRPNWLGSLLNLIPLAFLVFQLSLPDQLMHPESPIQDAEAQVIQLYFYFLTTLCVLLAGLLGRWFFRRGELEGQR